MAELEHLLAGQAVAAQQQMRAQIELLKDEQRRMLEERAGYGARNLNTPEFKEQGLEVQEHTVEGQEQGMDCLEVEGPENPKWGSEAQIVELHGNVADAEEALSREQERLPHADVDCGLGQGLDTEGLRGQVSSGGCAKQPLGGDSSCAATSPSQGGGQALGLFAEGEGAGEGGGYEGGEVDGGGGQLSVMAPREASASAERPNTTPVPALEEAMQAGLGVLQPNPDDGQQVLLLQQQLEVAMQQIEDLKSSASEPGTPTRSFVHLQGQCRRPAMSAAGMSSGAQGQQQAAMYRGLAPAPASKEDVGVVVSAVMASATQAPSLSKSPRQQTARVAPHGSAAGRRGSSSSMPSLGPDGEAKFKQAAAEPGSVEGGGEGELLTPKHLTSSRAFIPASLAARQGGPRDSPKQPPAPSASPRGHPSSSPYIPSSTKKLQV